MKRILIPLFLLLMPLGLFAQLNPPSLPAEDEFNSGINWDIGSQILLANTNAYSLHIGSQNIDLYTATWDGGQSSWDSRRAGFLVRQYPSGTAVNSSTTPTWQDYVTDNAMPYLYKHISSTEAGIIQNNGNIYIIFTYYGLDTPGNFGNFYLALYQWLPGSGSLSLVQGPLQLSTSSIPAGQTDGWIHQDVDDNNEVVVTWTQNGQLYTRAALFSSPGSVNVTLQGTGIIPTPAAGKPDVAMMIQPNGQTDLYYTFTTPNGSQLYVYKANWNQLSSFPPTSTQTLPATQLYQKNTNGIFGLPRIDAPNRSVIVDDIWSITVANHQGSNNYIFAASHSNATGLHEQVLNDGTLGSLPDISTGNYQNNRPTVSFSRQNNDLNYAWVFQDLSNGAPTYIGTKTTLSLGLLNNPSTLYFQLPYNNYNRTTPAVALSTNNLGSNYLFTSFIQTPSPNSLLLIMGLKTAAWTSNTGYRPAPTGISETIQQSAFSVSPNPFRSGFHIDATAANQDLDISVFNILGQKVYQDKGTLAKINRGLQSIGQNLDAGTYFMELKNLDGNTFRKEVIKW